MVADQIMSRGVLNPRVIGALQKVPREEFVPKTLRVRAYEDAALPIACKQTLSQLLMVALMSEALALKGSERVLEVGTGSGSGMGRLAFRKMPHLTLC